MPNLERQLTEEQVQGVVQKVAPEFGEGFGKDKISRFTRFVDYLNSKRISIPFLSDYFSSDSVLERKRREEFRKRGDDLVMDTESIMSQVMDYGEYMGYGKGDQPVDD